MLPVHKAPRSSHQVVVYEAKIVQWDTAAISTITQLEKNLNTKA